MQFAQKYTHTIMDGAVIRFVPLNRDGTVSSYHKKLEVSASRNGVAITGFAMFSSAQSTTELKQVIDHCANLYYKLRKLDSGFSRASKADIHNLLNEWPGPKLVSKGGLFSDWELETTANQTKNQSVGESK